VYCYVTLCTTKLLISVNKNCKSIVINYCLQYLKCERQRIWLKNNNNNIFLMFIKKKMKKNSDDVCQLNVYQCSLHNYTEIVL